jgi:hypothetical protein
VGFGGRGWGAIHASASPQKLLRKSQFEKMGKYKLLVAYNNCNYLK